MRCETISSFIIHFFIIEIVKRNNSVTMADGRQSSVCRIESGKIHKFQFRYFSHCILFYCSVFLINCAENNTKKLIIFGAVSSVVLCFSATSTHTIQKCHLLRHIKFNCTTNTLNENEAMNVCIGNCGRNFCCRAFPFGVSVFLLSIVELHQRNRFEMRIKKKRLNRFCIQMSFEKGTAAICTSACVNKDNATTIALLYFV